MPSQFLFMAFALFLSMPIACAQTFRPSLSAPMPGQVLVSGTVSDEASKALVLERLREVYGEDRVVDQIAIGTVMSPPNWSHYVQRLITPNLKLVSRGQLKVDGNNVSIQGEVANEMQRQQLVSAIATTLNPTYVVHNGLHVAAVEQDMLDALIAGRTIGFESSKATLTASGQMILDELSAVLAGFGGRKLEIIGHTDSRGLRERNLSLSQERVETVRRYLSEKGVDPDSMQAKGVGPDHPIASNESVEGRARNRRIEFCLVQ